MANLPNAERQYALTAVVPFTFADLTTGVLAPAVELPSDAVVLSGSISISTAFNSGTTDTLTVGDEDDDDRYVAGVNGQAAAMTALVPTGFQYTTTKSVGIKWTGVGTVPTQGEGLLIVQYVREGRSNEVQG